MPGWIMAMAVLIGAAWHVMGLAIMRTGPNDKSLLQRYRDAEGARTGVGRGNGRSAAYLIKGRSGHVTSVAFVGRWRARSVGAAARTGVAADTVPCPAAHDFRDAARSR